MHGLAAACFVLGLFAARPAAALSYVPLTPAQVASVSRDVVIATVVTRVDEVRADGSLVQHLVLSVRERWKGPDALFMNVDQLASVVDARNTGAGARGIAGNILLEVGATYLLFLREPTSLPRIPLMTAGEAGVYRAERDGDTWRLTTLDGRLVQGVSRTAWSYAGDPLLRPESPLLPSRGSRLAPSPATPPHPSRPAPPVAVAWRALVEVSR